MNSECPSIEKLVNYCDEELSVEEKPLIAAHIRNCENCRSQVQKLSNSLLAAKDIWTKLQPTDDEAAVLPFQKQLHIFTVPKLAIAAAVLVVAFGVFSFYRLGSREQHPEEMAVVRQIDAAQVQTNIDNAQCAARLLSATNLLADIPDTRDIAIKQYKLIILQYPETHSAKQAKLKVQKLERI